MSFKNTIIAAAVLAAGASAMTATSASAGNFKHYEHSCYSKKVKVPVWKTVWKTKKVKVSYGCGYVFKKKPVKIKAWRTKWKRVCH